MRPPNYFPPQGMMQQMPIAPRFPMYAPNFMRSPFTNQMPMPPQMPMQGQIPMQGQMPMSGQMPMPPQMPIQAAGGAPKLESFLAGANSLFSNAQKYTPYIQQAAPMFKNLPALWRMYKGFKDSPDPLESSTVNMPEERSTMPVEKRSSRQRPRQRQQQQPVSSTNPRPSVPMIFQPPTE